MATVHSTLLHIQFGGNCDTHPFRYKVHVRSHYLDKHRKCLSDVSCVEYQFQDYILHNPPSTPTPHPTPQKCLTCSIIVCGVPKACPGMSSHWDVTPALSLINHTMQSKLTCVVLRVCVCVCVCVCVHMCMHIHVCTCMCVCMYVRVHVCVLCVCVHVYVFTCMCVCACSVRVYVQINLHDISMP